MAADEPGAEPIGVVRHRAWRTRFGSDPDIVGRCVKLSGASVTIVGVGPAGYYGESAGDDIDFWLSLAAAGPVGGDFYWTTLERREDHWATIMRDTIAVVAAGVAAGLGLSLLILPVLDSVLFGVTSIDPLTFVAVGVVMLGVAAIAAYLPARRAARTDPVRALRFE